MKSIRSILIMFHSLVQKQHLGLVMNIFSALSKKSECEEHLNTPRHYHAVLCGYTAT